MLCAIGMVQASNSFTRRLTDAIEVQHIGLVARTHQPPNLSLARSGQPKLSSGRQLEQDVLRRDDGGELPG